MRLFWAKGYEATSISDLTERLGIGTKSLYAAFGSKNQLYTEALQLYLKIFKGVVWDGFDKAPTAREAVKTYLRDSAIGMTTPEDLPKGCMVTLGFLGSDENADLDCLVRSTRAGAFDLLSARLERAVEEGDLPQTADVAMLARYVQTVQSGMSIRARDGADREELLAVADVAMAGWDGTVGRSG